MSVRIPTRQPALPDIGDYQINQLVKGGTLQTLAEYGNFLEGWWFRRHIPIVVRPFDLSEGNTIQAGAQTSWIPLRTASFTQHIFVAVGISNLNDLGTVTVAVHAEPVEDGTGNATPGSGAITDPGCTWSELRGDLVDPVIGGDYQLDGLHWVHTGLALPAEATGVDPISPIPRVLHVAPNALQELVLTWEDVAVNSICVWELYRSAV